MENEKRLIDANTADVESIPCYYGGHCTTEDVQEWLNEQPTVDAMEVVHGRWIMDEYKHQYCCSVCGTVQPYDSIEDYIDPDILYYDYWDCNYCPYCGAKMDGGNKDG